MKKFLLLMLLCSLGLTSAMAQKTIYKFRDAQSRAGDAVSQVVVRPTIVEVNILKEKGRVTDNWKLSKEDVEVSMNGNLANLRAWGTYLSCQKYDCDVIMGATYKIESDSESDGYIISVTGFPGNFVNWHTATDAEFKWVELFLNSNGKASSIEPVVKNGKN